MVMMIEAMKHLPTNQHHLPVRTMRHGPPWTNATTVEAVTTTTTTTIIVTATLPTTMTLS